MISVCIPVYNTDVNLLVRTLYKQASAGSDPFEIILLDDDSADIETKQENEKLAGIPNVRIFENEQNKGLSATRNKLAESARYPYLLFIESDAEIVREDYWQTYISFCTSNSACFGGCVYSDSLPQTEFILRWKFGKQREEGVGKYFSCFNFLIPKDIFCKYPFSEKLNSYGYEDSLFGITLQHNNADIKFIDNPLLHTGLDISYTYLEKVESSIRNLITIEPLLKEIKKEKRIRLLKLYYSIQYLSYPIALLFRLLKKVLLLNLRGNNPSLKILDFYKLGYLCNLKTKKELLNQC